jgi:vancomycin resistance protein YoaR
MKAKTVNLLFFASIISFFASASNASAFEFVYNEKAFVVEEEVINSFKGTARLPVQSLLEKQPSEAATLANYLGSKFEPEVSKQQVLKFKPEKIYTHLKTLAQEINVAKTEPALEISDGKALHFSPPRDGLTLNLYETMLKTINSLEKNLEKQDLIVDTEKPLNALANTNSLGIAELVARGESNFRGSPKNRRHNIIVGVEKMTGIILKPGEEFSFNEHLGPVEEDQGFLPELVIKRTGTVPELGRGLMPSFLHHFPRSHECRLAHYSKEKPFLRCAILRAPGHRCHYISRRHRLKIY